MTNFHATHMKHLLSHAQCLRNYKIYIYTGLTRSFYYSNKVIS